MHKLYNRKDRMKLRLKKSLKICMKMTKMKCEKKNTWEKKYKQWMEGNK